MKKGTFTRFVRSLTALMLALMLPLNAMAATLTLPQALTVVEAEAFMNDTSVEEIVLPDGLKTIGEKAFAGCTALTSAVIPASVEEIAADAFEGLQGQLTIQATKDSYAWNWALENGFIVRDPSLVFDVTLGQTVSTLYLEGNLETARVADVTAHYDLAEGQSITWQVEKIAGDDGVTLSVVPYEGAPDMAYVQASGISAAGTSQWRVSAAAPGGETWQDTLTVTVANTPENYPTAIVGPDRVEGKVGERIELNLDVALALDGVLPEDGNEPMVSIGLRDLWGNETVESTENTLSFVPDQAGEYWINLRVAYGNWQFATEFCFVITGNAEVSFKHYFRTLYLGGNRDEMDVAEISLLGQVPEGTPIEWGVEKVSGDDCMDMYLGGETDGGLTAYAIANNIHAVGESVWRAWVKLEDGTEWSQEFTVSVIPLPENLPELDVDYPFTGEVGERFVFKPSERIRNLDAYPTNGNQHICGLSYYYEIWEDPTYESVDDGWNGAFAFTPAKSGRYGISIYYFIGNHAIEHHGIIVIGDGTTDENKLNNDLPPVIYLAGEDGDNYLGSLIVDRYHLLPGEEVSWSIELIDSSNAVPAADVHIGDLFENTLGANLFLGDVSGEPGTVTYLITAEVGGSVFTFEYELTVSAQPENLPSGITVPETAYQVQVGDTLTLLYEDIAFVGGTLPDGADIRKEYWNLGLLEDQQELEWVEEGISIHFVQEGRYRVDAVALINNIIRQVSINIIVGSGVPANARMDTYQPVSTLYTGLEENAHVLTADIQEYELLEGEEYHWNLEQISGDELFHVYIDNEYDNWRGVNIHADGSTDQTGSMTFRLTVTSDGGLELSTEFTIDVTEQPEGLPTEIILPQDLYELNVGDTLTLLFEDIRFGDGVIPEGNEIIRQYWGIENLPGYEWIDEGECATFDAEGRYTVDAVISVGNYRLIKRVQIQVGSGLENAELDIYQPIHIAYQGVEGEHHAFMAQVFGYELFEGESYTWNLEQISEGEAPLYVYINNEFDNWRGVNLHARDYNGTGSVTYRLTVTSEGGLEKSTEFTINVVELPEGLPTELVMETTEYQLNVGDELMLDPTMFEVGEGVIPEGMEVRKTFHDVENLPNMNWLEDNAFVARFDAEGRWMIYAIAEIGNYQLRQPIAITVGEGLANAELGTDQILCTVYAGLEEDKHAFTAEVLNYCLFEGEHYEWNIEQISEGESPVDVYFGGEFDNWRGVAVMVSGFRSIGSAAYRLTVTSESGLELSTEFTIDVVELPEGLPTELVLETTTYQLNAGDEFTFGPDQFDLGEGFIPDDATIRKSVRGVEELPNMNWVGDNEFTALFDHDGRWQFEVVVEINNYVVLQPVTITVGTGVSENTKIVERAFFGTQYANVGGGNWLGDFYLEDYRVLAGEELSWTLERTDDGDFHPADVVIDHQENDWCGIHVYNFTGETGLTSWKLTAESSLGGSWEKTFDINFVEMPENSPTEITAPQDVVYLEVGETYVTRISDYSFDVEVEDGADVLFELYSGEVEEHGEFYWTEDGFEVTFHQEGRYQFTVGGTVNGIEMFKDIGVVVGSPAFEDARLEADLVMDTAFYGEGMAHDAYVGYIDVEGYRLLPGEGYEWSVELIECEADGDYLPLELQLTDEYNDGHGVNLNAGNINQGTGDVTWRVWFRTDMGLELYYDVSFHVVDVPENLAVEISVPATEYSFDVGDEFELFSDDIQIVSCEGLDAEALRKEYWPASDIPGCEGRDTGIYFHFEEEGRYLVFGAARYGNFNVEVPVVITVGDNWSDDVFVEWIQDLHIIYTDLPEFSTWIGRATLYEYDNLFDGDVTWTLERVDDGQEPIVDLYYTNETGYVEIADLRYTNIRGTGTNTFRLTVNTSTGFTDTHDFAITVETLPENLPTDITGPDCYYVDVGELFVFNPDDYAFADGVVPENASTRFHYNSGDFETFRYYDTFEYLETGFQVSFDEEGCYSFFFGLQVGNYTLRKEIIIVVGDGLPGDVSFNYNQKYTTYYLNTDNVVDHMGWFDVNGYELAEGEHFDWWIEHVSGPDQVDMHLESVRDDNSAVWLYVNGCGGELATSTYRLHATTNHGFHYFVNFDVEVAECPEDLPTEVIVPQTEYHFEIGDSYEFRNEALELGEGNVPAGAQVLKEYWLLDAIPGAEQILENDLLEGDGWRVTFEENGRYQFYAAIRIESYLLHVPCTITVGTGVPDDAGIDFAVGDDVNLYNVPEAWWVNDACLNYPLMEGETIEWSMERIDDNGGDLGEAYVDFTFNDDTAAALRMRDITGETGDMTWRLTARVSSGYEASRELTIHVINAEAIPAGVTAPAQDVQLEVGETYSVRTSDIAFDVDVEGMTTYFEIYNELEGYPTFEWVDDGFDVTFEEDGRHCYYLTAIAGGIEIYQRICLQVGTGESGDAWLDVWHALDPVYVGGDETWNGNAMVQNFPLFEGETVQWRVEPVNPDQELPAELYIREGDYFENTLGVSYSVRNAQFTGEAEFVITAVLPTGQELYGSLCLHVQDMPENLPTELAMPDGVNILLGEYLDVYMDEIGFGEGEIPENAAVHQDAHTNDPDLSYEWIQTEDDRRCMRIYGHELGEYTFMAMGYIGNVCIMKEVTVNVVEPRIAIMTGSTSQGQEEYTAMQMVVERFGEDRVVTDTYSDNFADNQDDTIGRIENFAYDPSVKAIIVAQSVPGTLEGYRRASEQRDDLLLISCAPQEDVAAMSETADLVFMTDEAAQAGPIMAKCEEWGIDVFVHYSFPRHMEMYGPVTRLEKLKIAANALGVDVVEVTIPDPAVDGLDEANTFVAANVAEMIETYAGKKVAFFCTNCGVQAALQSAVLEHETAYYPSPCCPSPYHGFGESLNLALDLTNPQGALRAVAHALNRHGAAGRFSTWAAPVNMSMVDVAAEYAMAYASGEVEDNDSARITELFEERFGGADLTVNGNVYSVVLDPVDFTDYVAGEPAGERIAILTGTISQNEEEYTAAQMALAAHGEDSVVTETYPDNFLDEMDTTIEQIKAFGSDPEIGAIIVAQSVPGTLEAFESVAQTRSDVLLISCTPHDDLNAMSNAADVVLMTDEAAQAGPIMAKCEEWGVDVFVHYSFDRHLGLSAVAERLEKIKAAAAAIGAEVVEVTIPDPAVDGLDEANTFVAANVPQMIEAYAGKKVAFFCTNCGVQAALQSAVLAHENAYYPSPCCPSPYHGFGASLGLELDLSDPASAISAVANALNEHGAAGRFSTWAVPVNMSMIEAAASYAMAYVNGEVGRNDTEKVIEMLGNANVSVEGNVYSVVLNPVDFEDYLN